MICKNKNCPNREDAEKWRKIANHKHFARYKKCQICDDVMSKPIDGNGSVGVKGGLLCTICWECEGLRERLKKRIEECEDKSDFESVGEVEFTYRLENELQKILREGFSEEVKKSSLRIKHEKIDKDGEK